MSNLTIKQEPAQGNELTGLTLSKDFQSNDIQFNAIHFNVNEKTPLILKEDGFYYNGEHIKDAGEAHRLFLNFMYGIRDTLITASTLAP